MTTILLFIYGLTGLLLGYNIPYVSNQFTIYKKKNIPNKSGFLNATFFKIALSIFNGSMWYMSALMLDNQFVAFLVGIMITTGLIIAYIDISIRIIPNEILFFMIITGAIFQLTYFGAENLLWAVISMVAMMVVFSSVAAFVGLGKVGAGDVKLAGAMGISLGYPLIIIAVMAMAVILFVFIGIGLLSKKIYMSTMLPFAPFIIAGYIFALITLLM